MTERIPLGIASVAGLRSRFCRRRALGAHLLFLRPRMSTFDVRLLAFCVFHTLVERRGMETVNQLQTMDPLFTRRDILPDMAIRRSFEKLAIPMGRIILSARGSIRFCRR